MSDIKAQKSIGRHQKHVKHTRRKNYMQK